ncbi:MAG TPA: thermonuclease family protein [Acidimicrobiales bacterium]
MARTAALCAVVAIVGGGAVRFAHPAVDGGGEGGTPGLATVVRVVDGDTLVVEIGGHEEHVRLIGIDTPESVAHDRPVECFGAEASDHLAELAPPGTAIRLERDIEPRDRYDRLLAYVHRAGDDLFVNRAQVAAGFAEASEYPPNTAHAADLARDERHARAAGSGLWSACGSADVPIGPPPGEGP